MRHSLPGQTLLSPFFRWGNQASEKWLILCRVACKWNRNHDFWRTFFFPITLQQSLWEGPWVDREVGGSKNKPNLQAPQGSCPKLKV